MIEHPAESGSRQTERRTRSRSAVWQERRERGRRFVVLLEEAEKEGEHRRPPSWTRADVPGRIGATIEGGQDGTTALEKDGSTSSGERKQADQTPGAE